MFPSNEGLNVFIKDRVLSDGVNVMLNGSEPDSEIKVFWAKTGGKENQHLWGPLFVHMADSAEIARLIWRLWTPNATKNLITRTASLSSEQAETLIVWLAAVHDLGKCSPSFQSKVPQFAEKVREAGYGISNHCENYPHAWLGQIIIRNWLTTKGWTPKIAAGYCCIVGGHHGFNPTEKDLDAVEESQYKPLAVLGDITWESAQNKLLDWAFVNSGACKFHDLYKTTQLPPFVQILLTGFVIMADWIASNSSLFPLDNTVKEWSDSKIRAISAWEELKLPRSLQLQQPSSDNDVLFHDRFIGLSHEATLRPVQKAAVTAARNMDEPGLIIIEAPMGCGKTEASLLCAEILAEKFGDGGLAYLLPTQATSNAMFVRVLDWLKALMNSQTNCSVQDIHLLHGKAELNEVYEKMAFWGKNWMGDDAKDSRELSVVAHQWFSGKKRGLLAPFVVGTVDQLLMAALSTKHAHLRHLGLSGKVVVVDEVHAYDAYMSVYLDRILTFLGKYNVPTILLSATLPPSRRELLLNAYQDKRDSCSDCQERNAPRSGLDDPVYPLITVASNHKSSAPLFIECSQDKRAMRVKVEFLPDNDDALINELRIALQGGGCVCVLRNTVNRAQQTYCLLKEQLDCDVKLVHARFIAKDRASNDAELVRQLGRDSTQRPKTLVIVATQVVEQSLDIDLDLLITDIAPIDLLLQRIGRLHRHERGINQSERPKALQQPRCIITGSEVWENEPPVFDQGICAVYERSILLRTVLALRNRLNTDGCLMIPTDIAPLIENVYESKEIIPELWLNDYKDALQKEKQTMQNKEESAKQWLLNLPPRFSLDGWTQNRMSTFSEIRGKAAVRDSGDSIEVVLVQDRGNGLEVLPWVAEELNISSKLGTGADIPNDASAHAAALCTVCLPPQIVKPYYIDNVISALEQSNTYSGWQESRWLAGMLPLVVDAQGEVTIACKEQEFHLKYSREIGLELISEGRMKE